MAKIALYLEPTTNTDKPPTPPDHCLTDCEAGERSPPTSYPYHPSPTCRHSRATRIPPTNATRRQLSALHGIYPAPAVDSPMRCPTSSTAPPPPPHGLPVFSRLLTYAVRPKSEQGVDQNLDRQPANPKMKKGSTIKIPGLTHAGHSNEMTAQVLRFLLNGRPQKTT